MDPVPDTPWPVPAADGAPVLSTSFPRVAVVSGSYGAGHDAAAREIGLRLEAAGCVVQHYDIVQLLPVRLGRLLRSAYFAQLRFTPGSWGTTLRRLQPGTLAYRVATTLLGVAGRSLVRVARDVELVVSTHPFASQALGRAGDLGRLTARTVTYLTDYSVHPLWVHRGVDLHLALHEVAAQQARRWGATSAVISPLVPVERPVSMRGMDPSVPAGVPADRPIALIVGGSLGIGQLEQAAADVAATGLMVPVVVCGRNERLRYRLDRTPGVVALGWRDDLPDLLAAASCVIQNAGGFMSLEALAAGTPVLTYRPIPGHGTSNAENLELAGLVPWVRRPEDLAAALAAVAGRVDFAPLPHTGPDLVAALAEALVPALAPSPVPAS